MELRFSKKSFNLFIEKAFIVFMLFIMARPLVQFARFRGLDMQVAAIILMYGIILVLAFVSLERFLYILLLDKWLLPLIALPLLSLLWTTNPADTLQELPIFWGATFLGVYMAMRFSIKEQMVILAWVVGIIALLSLFVSLLFPSIGRGTSGGEIGVWVGVFLQKNGLGRYMAIGGLVFWCLKNEIRPKWLMWAGFAFCCILMIMARSATSLVALVMTIGLQPLYRLLKWRRPVLKVILLGSGFLLFATVVGFFISQPETFFQLLGRNPERNTFYVRLSIWNELLPFIIEKPFLGHGFAAFWGEGRTLYGWTRFGWTTSHAHNGFIEIILQLGIVGLVFMVIHLLVNFRRALKMSKTVATSESLWAFTYLFVMIVLNMSYSMFWGQLTVPWVLYISLTLTMCLELRRVKVHQQVQNSEQPSLISAST